MLAFMESVMFCFTMITSQWTISAPCSFQGFFVLSMQQYIITVYLTLCCIQNDGRNCNGLTHCIKNSSSDPPLR